MIHLRTKADEMTRNRWAIVVWFSACALVGGRPIFVGAQELMGRVHDHSLLVAPDLPCVWPVGMTPHVVVPTRDHRSGGYRRELIVIDEHTGTQWDAPAHFVPPPGSGLPGAGPMGLLTNEKVPAWQFCGEACVIDVTEHIDDAVAGSSYLIRPDTVKRWEQSHRPLRKGDVALFRSDYTDRYYLPFPQGERFVAAALAKDAPGWPAPTPETMEYLAQQGVMTLGLDGASMGPLPDLAVATHQAGGKRGMIWIECATNLGALPATGAFVAILGAKHAGGSGGECRVVSISQPQLAARLISAARAERVSDLSVTLDENFPITWPGRRPGEEATRYVAKPLNAFLPSRGPYFAQTHILDGQVGTHVALPSFSLPPPEMRPEQLPSDVQSALAAYTARHAAPGTSAVRASDAPLEQLMGEAHVIDVRELTDADRTSAADAPSITREYLERHDRERPIRAGEAVLLQTGYVDRHWAPLPPSPAKDRLLAAPLAGEAASWPAPTVEALQFLHEKGVRCVGIDAPTLGGVEPRQAQEVYWYAAAHGMWPVEFLTGLDALREKRAFFLFAPIKLRDSAGGYGRALAMWDEAP